MLIVDDQRLSRSRLIQLVDWQGLGIRLAGEAANGQEAMDKIVDTDADLVLTDVRMPVMNGLQLIEKAREQFGTDIGFIVTSGYDEFEYVRQSLRMTVADYLLKPVDGGELNKVLRRFVDSRRELTARHAAMLRQRQEQWLYYVVEGVFDSDAALLEAEAADAGFAGEGRAYAVASLGPQAEPGAAALDAILPPDAVRIIIRTRGTWLAALSLPAGAIDGVSGRGQASGLRISEFVDKPASLSDRIRSVVGQLSDRHGVSLEVGENNQEEPDSGLPDSPTGDIRQAMLEMKAYIDRHYRESLTLTELAKRMYISPGYFCSLFRQTTGVNYLEYIAGLRMDLAKRLLSERPELRINEVAELCGYQDLKYFRKLFKRYHGVTPMKLKETRDGSS